MDLTLEGTSGEETKTGNALIKAVSHTRDCYSELVERLEKDLVQMRQTLDNKERSIDQLQRALNEEKKARSLVDEELNQTRITSSEQEKRLTNEASQMRRTIIDKDQLVDEIRKQLNEEQKARRSLNEELKQTIVAYSEMEKRLQNNFKQMNETLDARGIAVDELHRKLEEEQRARAVVDIELNKARTAYTDLEERSQNDLAQMHATLGGKENAIDKLKKDLEQEQRMRAAIEKDFSQATNNHLQFEKMWENQKEKMHRSLNEKQKTVNELQRKLDQVITAYDNELEQMVITLNDKERIIDELEGARIAYTDSEERLQNDLSQIRATLGNKERIIDELERARTTLDEELLLARNDNTNLLQRLQNEQLASQKRQRVLHRRLEEIHRQNTALEGRLRNLEEERNTLLPTVRELQSALSRAQEAAVQSRNWFIQREEVVVSETELGRGSWCRVRQGTFRGLQVAVKEMHNEIRSGYNQALFEKEISILSICSHPNLLQFIGVVNDNGNLLFVTEILDTSLRQALSPQQRALIMNPEEIFILALDVSRALNYLHLNRPRPILHRDVSSANVLLWRRDNFWRAKLSDLGSARFMHEQMDRFPGAPIYSAPETQSAQQSPKVKI